MGGRCQPFFIDTAREGDETGKLQVPQEGFRILQEVAHQADMFQFRVVRRVDPAATGINSLFLFFDSTDRDGRLSLFAEL